MPIQAWRHLLKYMRGEDLHLQLNALFGLTSPCSPLARADHMGPRVALSRQGSWGVQASLCWKESVSAHTGDAKPSSEPQGRCWSPEGRLVQRSHLTRDRAIPQAPPSRPSPCCFFPAFEFFSLMLLRGVM